MMLVDLLLLPGAAVCTYRGANKYIIMAEWTWSTASVMIMMMGIMRYNSGRLHFFKLVNFLR